MHCHLSLSVVLAALVLAGCAGPVTQRVSVDAQARAQEEEIQKRIAFRTMFELESRLWTVGYAVLKGAATECGANIRPSLGFWSFRREDLPAQSRDVAAAALGVNHQRRVYAVYNGGAAHDAGMRRGDIIIDAPPKAFRHDSNETREAAAQRLPVSQPVSIQVLRDAEAVTLTLMPDIVCDFPLKVSQGGSVNAYADGTNIIISRGMLRFASEDRELALVIGHELGHNTMGHSEKKKANAVVGGVFDILAAAYGVNTQGAFMNAGAGAYSKEFEAEADYVGMYYLSLAGYETAGAADFWRRMAAEHPSSIQGSHSSTHPATTERFLSLEKVHSEVQAKRTGNLPMAPNRLK